ncbi:MAG: hypothetical protein JXC32_18005, partial [Anaerolineae bacterium]|nr:hypothetical protein [Anaerolineae bacterium]
VTLVWRAEAGAAEEDLKVFVHLITEDGPLVAQDDAKPVGWSRPTSSWLPGEIIIDAHPLTWHDRAVTGTAQIRVGFYDEGTGARQVWSNGEDAYELPVAVTIGAP